MGINPFSADDVNLFSLMYGPQLHLLQLAGIPNAYSQSARCGTVLLGWYENSELDWVYPSAGVIGIQPVISTRGAMGNHIRRR